MNSVSHISDTQSFEVSNYFYTGCQHQHKSLRLLEACFDTVLQMDLPDSTQL